MYVGFYGSVQDTTSAYIRNCGKDERKETAEKRAAVMRLLLVKRTASVRTNSVAELYTVFQAPHVCDDV
jgi:hypothetical protein